MIGSETKQVGISPLTAIFATPTLAALLSVFAREPERTYIQKELVQASGSSLYLVQRELKRLERAGLVGREDRGRQVEYSANITHPAFQGLREALLATVALGDALRERLSRLEDVRLAFIFGSVASGTDNAESDVDIVVVGGLGLRDVSVQLVPLMRDVGREPNLVVMSEADLRDKVRRGDHFISDVLAGPRTWLVGDDADLAAVLGD